ncbi:hypothetical protein TNCV_5005621 [Trichonephila clavipes]|nr:hypothetical protein TNCV_5005621 [Trichonephila clavipes]
MRDIRDEPLYFKPQSSDKDDIRAGTRHTIPVIVTLILKGNLMNWKPNFTYLTGSFTKLNEVNLDIQDDSISFIKTRTVSAFLSRVKLKYNTGGLEFSQLVTDNLSGRFDVRSDFETRFENIL